MKVYTRPETVDASQMGFFVVRMLSSALGALVISKKRKESIQ